MACSRHGPRLQAGWLSQALVCEDMLRFIWLALHIQFSFLVGLVVGSVGWKPGWPPASRRSLGGTGAWRRWGGGRGASVHLGTSHAVLSVAVSHSGSKRTNDAGATARAPPTNVPGSCVLTPRSVSRFPGDARCSIAVGLLVKRSSSIVQCEPFAGGPRPSACIAIWLPCNPRRGA